MMAAVFEALPLMDVTRHFMTVYAVILKYCVFACLFLVATKNAHLVSGAGILSPIIFSLS